jgi:hypothetical protein
MSLSKNGAQENISVDNDMANNLFVGDTGELELDTRRALVLLLSGPSLDGRRHTKLWPVLVRDKEIIRRRLADLFLELVIDLEQQVAFTRQADTGDLEVPLLLRRSPLTFIDSVLLLFLRRQLAQAESHGERAVVSKGEIIDHLGVYERSANTDKAGFTKRIHASIEKIKERSILQKIRASDDRFEVSPTLKLLFSAEEIQALSSLYQRMASDGSSVDEPSGDELSINGEEES